MMAPGHCNREQKKLGCQTYFWVSSVRTELSRKNRKYFATQTSPRAWQLLSEQQQKNMSDLLFLLLRKACDSSFSKQTLQKCWKESFWSDKDYSSFYKLIIPLCRAWFVSLDLLQAFFFFKCFSSVSHVLGYPRGLFILRDKLEAVVCEPNNLDETRGLCCVTLGTDLSKPQLVFVKWGLARLSCCFKD